MNSISNVNTSLQSFVDIFVNILKLSTNSNKHIFYFINEQLVWLKFLKLKDLVELFLPDNT